MASEPVNSPVDTDGVLGHTDLIAGAIVPMPLSDMPPVVMSPATDGTGTLRLADLLDSGSAGLSDAGGFVMFEHQSTPGSTLVRVMLEGADHQQLFDIGTLAGGPDLNSLLGLIATDGSAV